MPVCRCLSSSVAVVAPRRQADSICVFGFFIFVCMHWAAAAAAAYDWLACFVPFVFFFCFSSNSLPPCTPRPLEPLSLVHITPRSLLGRCRVACHRAAKVSGRARPAGRPRKKRLAPVARIAPPSSPS